MTEKEITTKFAAGIVRWRKRLNMTPVEFAKFVGTGKNTIYNYESGRSMPQLYVAMRIAEKLGISLDELLNSK